MSSKSEWAIPVPRRRKWNKEFYAPIEGAVRSVDGIQRIISEAREGRGEVLIELVAGQHRMKAFQDIDQAVNRIRTFPDRD